MKNKSNLYIILFLGAVWGILEATLGHILHFLPTLISGSVMFPIAASIMYITFNQTQSRRAMVYVAAIAVLIKTVDFFLPGLPAIKIYNPMIAIMLQSFAMVVFIPMFKNTSVFVKLTGITLVGLSWRTAFLANDAINHAISGFNFPQLANFSAMVSFVVFAGLIEALILGVIFFTSILLKNKVQFSYKPNWVVAVSVFALAIVLNIVL